MRGTTAVAIGGINFFLDGLCPDELSILYEKCHLLSRWRWHLVLLRNDSDAVFKNSALY